VRRVLFYYLSPLPKGMTVRVRNGLILPESTGGEAWGCQDSREGGLQLSVVLVSTVLFGNQKQWSARWGHSISIVEGRFLCFVSLSPKDQEMKCRHAQWLIAIKNIANIQPELT
jgi:hypothetical protein